MNDSLLVFTDALSRLCRSGLRLPSALHQMWSCSHFDRAVKLCAVELSSAIDSGMRLSSALSVNQWIQFPSWYVSFMTLAEEGSSIVPTLEFLCTLIEEKRKTAKTFILSACYPFAVCAACFIFSCIVPSLFGSALSGAGVSGIAGAGGVTGGGVVACGDVVAGLTGAGSGSFFFPQFFLVSFVCAVLFAMKKVIRVDEVVLFVNSLSFLSSSSHCLSQSLEAVLPVVRSSRRLSEAVEAIHQGLLEGKSASTLFLQELKKRRFYEAARVCALELSLQEGGAKEKPFERAAKVLGEGRKRKKEIVLSSVQPLMLCASALYMVLVLKDSVLPYLFPTNIGF